MSDVTISKFLEARVSEDERMFDCPPFVAEDSARGPGWGSRGDCPICGAYQFSGAESVTEDAWWEHAEEAHWRNAWINECAAKRRIIEIYEIHRENRDARRSARERHEEDYVGVWERRMAESRARVAEDALRALAVVYAQHPDYREEWRP